MSPPASPEIEQLRQALAAIEAQRAALGDVAADAAIAGLRQKLAEKEVSPAPEQRKLITILFADLAGFTAMSETMDPEDVGEIMNAYFALWRAAIVNHGGAVEKFIGDAVMAVFGIPQAGERDAENAIRAALDALERLAGLNAGLAQTRQLTLGVRIGINTGWVMVEEPDAEGGFVVFGDAVNTASRLQSVAPVGGILIAHETFRLVRGVFDVDPPQTIQVKGRREAVRTYLIRRARPRAFRMGTRGIEGIETRMVGRDAELERLQTALQTTQAARQCHWLTILGDAGIGKSRLLYEFNYWLDLLPEPVAFFKGRASQELQHQPYALLRDLFAYRFQIQDSDPPVRVREKMTQGMAELLGHDERGLQSAEYLGQLLGFDFSASLAERGVLNQARLLRDRALAALRDYFRAVADEHPAVVLLEDAHWADESSLDALEALALELAGFPLLLVVTARPSLNERRPRWGEPAARRQTLELQPLSSSDSRSLVDEILRHAEQIPETLYELVAGQAEGNPYYVEELIKMLVEENAIRKEETRWVVDAPRLTRVNIPATLTGLLQARLDSLPAAEQAAVQRAAVIGRTFWDAALAYLNCSPEESGPAAPRTEENRLLAALQARELVFQRSESSFAEAREYVFKHDILRQVAYAGLPRRERRLHHRRVAEWLMLHSGERSAEFTGPIADHLEASGQAEQALLYLTRAGERAAARFASAEAIACLTRALRLAPDADAGRRFELILAREKVYSLRGARQEERHDLSALDELAETLNDDRKRAAVALRQAQYADVTADYPAAIAAAQRAIQLAQTSQDTESEAAGHLLWGRVLWRKGEHEAAIHRLEQALTLARRAGLRQLEADSLRNLGIVSMYRQDSTRAGECYQQALALCRQIGDRQGESAALHNLGILANRRGDHPAARQFYEQGLQIFREIGDKRFEANALIALGSLNEFYGQYPQAIQSNEQALNIFRAIGDRWGECGALVNLGLFTQIMGEQAAARQHGEAALLLANELGARPLQAYALTVLGRAHAALGDLAAAAEASQQACEIRSSLGEQGAELEALAGVAAVWLEQGRLDAARQLTGQILEKLGTQPELEMEDALRVYWTCYRVLSATGEGRAPEVLAQAGELLRARAARIADASLRRSFLENVPLHRNLAQQLKW